MKKSYYSQPDSFTLFPAIALLPQLGNISKLKELQSSLFARYERAKGLSEDGGKGLDKKRQAEALMLKQVFQLDVYKFKREGRVE